jgi:hypothetical protein
MKDVQSVSHSPAGPLRQLVASAEGYGVPANPTGLHRGLPSRYLTLVVELAAALQVTGLRSSVTAHGVVGGPFIYGRRSSTRHIPRRASNTPLRLSAGGRCSGFPPPSFINRPSISPTSGAPRPTTSR